MGSHFATPVPRSRPGRRRQAGLLSIALGVGLLAFAFLDEEGTPVRSTSPTIPPSSEPTVLGVTVEPEPSTSDADPATPFSLVAPDDADGSPSGPSSPSTTSRPTSTGPTTTTEAPVLIPPTVVTNTVPTRPTTTTTTAPTTTTTQAPTTTEAPTTTTTAGTDG